MLTVSYNTLSYVADGGIHLHSLFNHWSPDSYSNSMHSSFVEHFILWKRLLKERLMVQLISYDISLHFGLPPPSLFLQRPALSKPLVVAQIYMLKFTKVELKMKNLGRFIPPTTFILFKILVCPASCTNKWKITLVVDLCQHWLHFSLKKG